MKMEGGRLKLSREEVGGAAPAGARAGPDKADQRPESTPLFEN